MENLARFLSTLTADRLAAVITRRPEARLPPEPTSISALAARLAAPHAVGAALIGLTRPDVQVAEALAALGDGCSRAGLAAALGIAEGDPRLTTALERLAEHAIAWPDGDTVRTVPLDGVWPQPLGLGSSLATLLNLQRTDQLRGIARELGVRIGTHKAAMVRDLAGWLADGERVRRLAATAPKATRELLDTLAWKGPYLVDHSYLYRYGAGAPRPAAWAVERGLLASDGGWGAPLEMPREVALALRGGEYRLPFDPTPPVGRTVPVGDEIVEREATAAATAAVSRIAAVLEECAKAPVTPLKNGGVGVRELRRLARSVADSEDNVRLYLELAAVSGLAAMAEAGLLPTDAYDEWRQRQPAQQLTWILGPWQEMDSAPLQPPEEGASRRPAFEWTPDSALVPTLRAAVLGAVAALPSRAAVPGLEPVVELVRWLRPVTADAADDLPGLVRGLWREAELLGAIAHNTATALARALVADDRAAISAIAERMLPPAQDTVLLQADLTAVAVGAPSSALAALLDGAAGRESRGGAWTWRFSAASVRGALDAGMSGEELLGRLREVASGGRVPQPLEYLINDVARRHGRVRVRPVACCLRCDDPALLAEILRAKGLAKLRLSALAPTVLASAEPVDRTLATLRAAGYTPVGERADGTVALERAPRQRAPLDERLGPGGLGAPAAGMPVQGLPGRGIVTQADAYSALAAIDRIPDELLDDLLDGIDGPLPEGLLSSLMTLRSGGPPPEVSEPDALARRLLDGDPGRPGENGRRGRVRRR